MIAAALFALLPTLAAAVPCVQFDSSFNLYAFGGSSDVGLGASSTWSSPSPKTLSSSGRPPWTGNSTQCLLSQYNNAMVVLGADASDLSKVYIYSFANDAWSTQATTDGPPNLGNSRSASILDHDTNVVFTLPSGSGSALYQLDLSSVTSSASSSSLAWSAVENPSFSVDGYTPTAAQASNHINYFGVPGTTAGNADIFVVHYAYFQPTAQSYPTQNNGNAFPDSAGQAFSVPDANDNVPLQMVFIPNDFSSSYVVTHWTDPGNYATTNTAPFSQSLINSTQILPAPSSKDTQASYAASPDTLVQIDSNGDIYYMTSAISSYQVSSSAQWTKLSYSLAGVSGGSSSSSNTSTTSGSSSGTASRSSTASGSTSRSGSQTASATGAAATTSRAAAMSTVQMGRWDLAGLAMGFVALGASALI